MTNIAKIAAYRSGAWLGRRLHLAVVRAGQAETQTQVKKKKKQANPGREEELSGDPAGSAQPGRHDR